MADDLITTVILKYDAEGSSIGYKKIEYNGSVYTESNGGWRKCSVMDVAPWDSNTPMYIYPIATSLNPLINIENMQATIEAQEAEIKRLRDALESLCPVSLKAALRELDLITNREDIEDCNLENAKMHIGCELQRMESAQAALNKGIKP